MNIKQNNFPSRTLLSLLLVVLFTGSAVSGELVYQPVNPNFGGSPLNASGLMNSANAQNEFTDPSSSTSIIDTATSQLQRLAISAIQRAELGALTNDKGELQAGTFEFGNLTIIIKDFGDGKFKIDLFDRLTGDEVDFNNF